MRKLWIFGDSYSIQWDETHPYSVWKGYTPKNFADRVSERLEIECINHAHSGWSNYDIFESICENVDKISSDDIVIVGWSGLLRFRMAHPKFNQWISFQPNNWDVIQKAGFVIDGFSESTCNEIIYNRSHSELYKKEILNWINLLKHTFKSNTFINWTWSRYDWELTDIPYEVITNESNGEISDWHWSEKGHLDFSEWVLSKIEMGGFINDLI